MDAVGLVERLRRTSTDIHLGSLILQNEDESRSLFISEECIMAKGNNSQGKDKKKAKAAPKKGAAAPAPAAAKKPGGKK